MIVYTAQNIYYKRLHRSYRKKNNNTNEQIIIRIDINSIIRQELMIQ